MPKGMYMNNAYGQTHSATTAQDYGGYRIEEYEAAVVAGTGTWV